MPIGRIAYIDAMRGATMILVVYSHLCGFCLGDWAMAGNGVLMLFRLPCFFFVSGWLFGRMGPLWERKMIRTTVRHKFMVQIVPTFIFLLLLAPPPEFFMRLGAMKGGYWFTFVLFEFFIICMLSERLFKRRTAVFALVLSLAAFLYDAYYNTFSFRRETLRQVLGFLSFSPWRFYVFFYFGVVVRRHFGFFLSLMERPYSLPLVTSIFAVIALLPHVESPSLSFIVFLLSGTSGVVMVFVFFRRFSSFIVRIPGLTFCGTRTLDIYLLHYFFLPRFLVTYTEYLLSVTPFHSLVILMLSIIIVTLCLATSGLLRLSPFLAHYLFGAKSSASKN
jgi:fucose 4-O-acetylase-like acetyltransferase